MEQVRFRTRTQYNAADPLSTQGPGLGGLEGRPPAPSVRVPVIAQACEGLLCGHAIFGEYGHVGITIQLYLRGAVEVFKRDVALFDPFPGHGAETRLPTPAIQLGGEFKIDEGAFFTAEAGGNFIDEGLRLAFFSIPFGQQEIIE